MSHITNDPDLHLQCFNDHGIFTLDELNELSIVKLHTCLFLYDHIHDKKSSKFSFSFISEQHNYATRSASTELLQIPSFRINIRKFCPSIIGRYFWNNIPPNIRTKPYKKLFKKALLKFYFSQY